MGKVKQGVSNLILPKEKILTATEGKLWEELYKLDPNGDQLPLGWQLTLNRAFLLSIAGKLIKGTYDNHDGQRPLFTSQHQTWAGFRHMRKKGSTLPGQAMVVMPEQHASLGISDKIGRAVGPMPFVGYSGHKHRGKPVDYSVYDGFSQVVAQIMPEMRSAQVVSNGGDPHVLKEDFDEQNIDGLIIGSNHFVRKHDKDGSRLDGSRVLEAARSSGVMILGAHAEYGRGDNSDYQDAWRTRRELRAAVESPEAIGRTAMGHHLAMAYNIAEEQNPGPDFEFEVIHEVTNDVVRDEYPKHDPYDVIRGAIANMGEFLNSQSR